jgi:hypothetical protein
MPFAAGMPLHAAPVALALAGARAGRRGALRRCGCRLERGARSPPARVAPRPRSRGSGE